MTSATTKLQVLRERIERLPGLKERVELVQTLTAYTEALGDACTALRENSQAAAAVVRVFPEPIEELTECQKKAARVARRLKKSLSQQIASVVESKTETAVEEIKEQATVLRKAVAEAWRSRLGATVGDFRKVTSVAKDAGLPGAAKLLAQIEQLGKQPVPADEQQAQELETSIQGTREAVSGLELKGVVGQFLTAAVQGTATADQLQNEEVQAYLKRKKLWDRIAVRIG